MRNRGAKMLIDFTVRNFRSIKDTQTLSMEPGERLTRHGNTNVEKKYGERVLKNLVMFGPNGAGKSNMLKALLHMNYMVVDPTKNINEKLNYIPFRLCKQNQLSGSFFKVRFLFNEKIYSYEFEYDESHIISEKLSYKKADSRSAEIVYFDRNLNGFYVNSPELKDFVNKTRPNRLFLSVAQDMNDSISADVMNWFSYDLIYLNGFNDRSEYELLNDDDNKQSFIKFMNYVGADIVDVEVKKTKRFDDSFIKILMENGKMQFENELIELFLNYRSYDINGEVDGVTSIQINEESTGTRKLIGIALAMLKTENRGKVIVIDEFDDSLHLELSKALINLFNSKENHNQYILTSHEIQLMDCDLRVDQVYLIEKQFNGASELVSLFDFNELYGAKRSDISYASRYLKGQFGALPKVEVSGILKVITEA